MRRRFTMSHNWGNPANQRFYYGSKTSSPWNQELHKRALNEAESKYLLEIQAGSHSSQHILKTPKRPPTVRDLDEDNAETARTEDSACSNFSESIGDLRSMNTLLRTQLGELNSYLRETNSRLEFLETGQLPSRRTQRSLRTGRTGMSTRRARSVIDDARNTLSRGSGRFSRRSRGLTARSFNQGPELATGPSGW